MASKLTLGIAKIGDLLVKNMITVTSDGDVLENITLKIPEYQPPTNGMPKMQIRC